MDTIPIVLIFDVEPDTRNPRGRGPEACLGFEKLVGMVPALRDRLSTAADAPAVFTWAVRIDPQIGSLFGSPSWLAERYERELSLFRAAGDDVAIHPHSWRWQGRWISDEADAGWVAHCIDVALDGFQHAFGEPCRVHKHGDQFMSTAVTRQLDGAGISVDYTIEPGIPATRALSPAEETTGWIPDTTTVPSHAYRPSRDDFRVPDPTRDDGLVLMPLTSGLRFARRPGDARLIPTAVAEPLNLWSDASRFREQLHVRLATPGLTHLAFAIRTDTVLHTDLWATVEANQAEVASQLRDRHEWCGGLDGAHRAVARLRDVDGLIDDTLEQTDARAHQWARGRSDLGFREGVDLEALDVDDDHPLLVEAEPGPPPVTAILPVYAGRRHVREAVESVIDQTLPPEELIVVNDGSAAEDLDFLHGLTAPFRIRVLDQANAGQSAARNRGAEVATGDLLAFLDQDDSWHPRHLAVLTKPFRDDPEVVWSYSDFDEIDADGRDVTRAYLRQHGIAHPKSTLGACLERDLMVLPSASVVRRDLYLTLGGFDETLRGYEDEDLYVRAFRTGGRFAFHDEALTRYRVHRDGDSAGRGFAESRRRFSQKLRETVTDDRRSGRYYFRDLVAPRFFATSLDDYVRAVSARDWPASQLALQDLRYYGRFRRDRSSVVWKLALVSNPPLFRRLLRVHDLLPASLRLTKNPTVRLR